MLKQIDIVRKINGREEIRLQLEVDASGNIVTGSLSGIGGLSFLKLIKELQGNLKGQIGQLKIPDVTDNLMSHHLIREVFLRAKGEWHPPYSQEQMCHCRSVPTAKILDAIYSGAKTAQSVSRWTSASTACGTCMPDVQSLIDYFKTSNTGTIGLSK